MSHTLVAGDLERMAERCQVTGTRSAKPSSDVGSRWEHARLQNLARPLLHPHPWSLHLQRGSEVSFYVSHF